MKTQLKTGEKVVLETKLHWLTMVVPFVILAITMTAGILIGGFGLLLILVGALYFMYKMVERNNNIWAVTSLRVIDEFGVFTNNAKESPLDKINNVSYRQSFWGKVFGFGNVQIQTAAEIGSTDYAMVAGPRQLKDSITRMQEAYKENQMRKQASELAGALAAEQARNGQSIAAELEKLFELKQRGILTEEEFAVRKAKLLS
jgi:uncharacterized membrane protein YdbT with pleckstrin-like domain